MANRPTALLEAAHGLSHIPPVARVTVSHLRIENDGSPYLSAPYVATSDGSVAIALRPGERLTLEVDLRGSFVEGGAARSYTSLLVRGPGTLTAANAAGSVARLEVAWTEERRERELRTDVALGGQRRQLRLGPRLRVDQAHPALRGREPWRDPEREAIADPRK